MGCAILVGFIAFIFVTIAIPFPDTFCIRSIMSLAAACFTLALVSVD